MPTEPTRQKSLGTIAKRLWGHLGRHRGLYVLGLALGVVDAVCQTSIPMVFREVLNRLQADPVDFMQHWFRPALAVAGLLVVLFLPAAFFFHVFVALSGARLTRDMRTALYQHVQRLSADFFHRQKVGEIAQRLNNDMDALGTAVNTVMMLVWQACVVAWSMTMMLAVDWRLALVFDGLMIAVACWSRLVLPKLRRLSRNVRDAVGEVSATVTEYVAVSELIRSFANEPLMDERVDQASNQLRQRQEHLAWRQFIFFDLMQVLTRFVAPLTLLFAGAWMLTGGYLRIGDLVAFWGYWLMMGGAVNNIVQTFGHIFTALASADRIFEYFDQTPTIQDAPAAIELSGVRGLLAFEGVRFSYPSEKSQVVLNDVSFVVPAGRRVAIVGPSGAGKSTILQLLLRFYDPDAGRIAIDGRDIRAVTQASLRFNIGLVMQDSVFLAGSIEENLLFARPGATVEQMRSALASANALDFIDEMPKGLETMLGERGVRLSGGQKQRLSIARAFLKDPPILLFDEATSSLDSLAERLVQSAMEKLMKGRTTIIVAHRISTVQSADEILVLDEGRITAQGRHDDLLRTSRLYRDLCTHQQVAAALLA